jgi:diphthamide synthase (EF-2-diphthine--ammonia ligase)
MKKMNPDCRVNLQKQAELEFYEKEMEKIKEEALSKLASFISPCQIQKFALILCDDYLDQESYAENIANEVGLSLLDFLAIADNEKAFRMQYQKELEWQTT